MLISAVYVLVVAQSSSEFPEGLMNNPVCVLHYDPQHVSSSSLLILRRTNCITTASGIIALYKQPYSMQVESGLQSALHLHTVRLFIEGDDTRGCSNTICPPEDEQGAARNVLRIVM